MTITSDLDPHRPRSRFLVLVLALAVLVAACGDDDGAESASDESSEEAPAEAEASDESDEAASTDEEAAVEQTGEPSGGVVEGTIETASMGGATITRCFADSAGLHAEFDITNDTDAAAGFNVTIEFDADGTTFTSLTGIGVQTELAPGESTTGSGLGAPGTAPTSVVCRIVEVTPL